MKVRPNNFEMVMKSVTYHSGDKALAVCSYGTTNKLYLLAFKQNERTAELALQPWEDITKELDAEDELTIIREFDVWKFKYTFATEIWFEWEDADITEKTLEDLLKELEDESEN